MKLCIEEEDYRPQYLTDYFFVNFMITETKRKATLQILQFHKKKELTYSTKISDGYFIVKVMLIQKAAEQLERGQVKLNYVVQGMLRNHGQGVIMIRDALKYWAYASKIGGPINWRLNRQNVNSKGHSFIVWNSQQLLALHGGSQKEEQEVKRYERGLIKKEESLQQHKPKKQQQQPIVVSEGKPIVVSEGKPIVVSEGKPIVVSEGKPIVVSEEKLIISDGGLINCAKIQQPLQRNNSLNSASTISLSQTQSAGNNQPNLKDKSPIFDLKFVFDFFEQEEENSTDRALTQQPITQQPISVPPKQQSEESEDEDFMSWFQSKNNTQLFANRQEQQLSLSQIRKREIYKQIMLNEADSDQEQTNNTVVASSQQSLVQPIISNSSIIGNSSNSSNNGRQKAGLDSYYITFSDIYHGLSARSSTNWWTTSRICCLGALTDKDYVNVMLSDQKGHYIMTAVFTNYSFLKIELMENRLYKLGNGLMRMSMDQLQRNISHCQLQFDCKKATIQPMQSEQSVKYRAENYTFLNKLYDLQDGMRINTFAVIKSIRNTEGKNGTMSHYELIDPIIKYSIVFTQFDSHLTHHDLTTLINTPITIYTAWTGSFRGRKNIVSRGKTIVKYNWLPIIHETDLIWQWLQDDGNHLEEVELNLVGYEECAGLDQIDSVADGRVFVRNVTVLDINDKYTYLGCVKCYKKVEDGRCRTCGKRNAKQIVERLLIRGNIGDSTNQLSVLWSNSFGQSILRDGLSAFKRRWQLKKVMVWLQRGSKQGYTIVKMQETQIRTRIKQLLQFLHRNIL